MILNRVGSKKRIAKTLEGYFPEHSLYIELFFGAGGMFFNKRKAAHNIVNDIDDDVYNVFRQWVDNKDELAYWLQRVPLTARQFKEWASGAREKTDVMNAVRYLVLSNASLYGVMDTLRTGRVRPITRTLKQIDEALFLLRDVQVLNADFRDVFKKVRTKTDKDSTATFVYADPPYVGVAAYDNPFGETDSIDLFDTLQASGFKWAMSEFDNPFILEQAQQRGLHVHTIGERCNIKNRRTEILVTNYEPQQPGMFL